MDLMPQPLQAAGLARPAWDSQSQEARPPEARKVCLEGR